MDEFAYFCIIVAAVLVLMAAAVLYLMVRVKPAVEYYYLVVGMTLGILFLFVIPPYMTPDEDVHIRASYYVSNYFLGTPPGNLLENEITVRQCDAQLEVKLEENRENYNYYLRELFHGAEDTTLTAIHYNIRSISRLWVYGVGALGIAFARLTGLGAVQTILMGGLFQVIFFVLATFYSIRKIPFGKMVLFTVALFPMTLQQTSSLSYDNLLIAAFFVLTALSLHWRFEGGQIKISEAVICLLADVVLLGIKGGAYALFIFLPAALQLKREMITKKRLLFLAVLFVVCGIVFGGRIGMYLEQLNNPERSGAYIAYADEYGYSLYELLHPVSRLLSMLWNTLWQNGRLYVVTMAGAALGWLHIILPGEVIWLYYVVLLGASLRKKGEGIYLRIQERVIIWGMCFVCTALIFVSMLLYWTPRSASTIEGIQGRYFLPYLPLAAYTLGLKRLERRRLTDEWLILCLLGLSALSCFFILRAVA